jgi:hypothetical protein
MPGAKPGAKPGPKSGRPARATTSTIQLSDYACLSIIDRLLTFDELPMTLVMQKILTTGECWS